MSGRATLVGSCYFRIECLDQYEFAIHCACRRHQPSSDPPLANSVPTSLAGIDIYTSFSTSQRGKAPFVYLAWPTRARFSITTENQGPKVRPFMDHIAITEIAGPLALQTNLVALNRTTVDSVRFETRRSYHLSRRQNLDRTDPQSVRGKAPFICIAQPNGLVIGFTNKRIKGPTARPFVTRQKGSVVRSLN